MPEDKQAVAETDEAQAKPAAEEVGAQDDLDALLSEFKAPDEPKPEQTETKDSELLARLERVEQDQIRRDVDSAVNEIAADISEGTPADNDLADAWLNARARNDDRLLKAFQDRQRDPAKWAKIQGGLKREFQKKFADLPDRDTTEAKQAVEAAVRGASTKAPDEDEAPNFAHMSDGELNRWKREHAR